MNFQDTKSFSHLIQDFERISKIKIIDLFNSDNDRVNSLSFNFFDYYIDFSKNKIDKLVLKNLINIVHELNLKNKIEDLFSGKELNFTEKRAVMHMALRAKSTDIYNVNEVNVVPKVIETKNRLYKCSDDIRNGTWLGITGKKIDTIINIGIGGSDLSPLMAYEALKYYSNRNMLVKFLSNVDSSHFYEIISDINPETTVFIIASKTFTTDETMTNAFSAKKFMIDKLGNACVSKHFIALSTNSFAVSEFGIDEKNRFEFWDWVGGRYSLASAIGLPVMIAIGKDNFEEMLRGMSDTDNHFRHTEFSRNIPVLMALVGFWYVNFFKSTTECVVPYEQYLHRMAAHLQQVEMESNCKSVDSRGNFVNYPTGPIVWGGTGTNYEHSTFQLIHQGTHIVPIDFIAYTIPLYNLGDHHHRLIAHMFAQSEALAFGKNIEKLKSQGVSEELIPHKYFPGDRPSTTLLGKKLTPRSFGQLLALYEHKVFVQGILWNINSFDQFGVELGKELSKQITREFNDPNFKVEHDDSTNALIQQYLANIIMDEEKIKS